MLDIFILLACLILRETVMFVYALKETKIMAEESLQDEWSVLYRAFSIHFKSKRSQYLQEMSHDQIRK